MCYHGLEECPNLILKVLGSEVMTDLISCWTNLQHFLTGFVRISYVVRLMACLLSALPIIRTAHVFPGVVDGSLN